MEYLKIGIGLAFIVLQVYFAYVKYTSSKADDKKLEENIVLQTAQGIYQFIRKEDMLGNVVGEKRIIKALDLLQETLYSDHQIELTAPLKKKAMTAIKGWHAEDKANKLSMDSVAKELDQKKLEG